MSFNNECFIYVVFDTNIIKFINPDLKQFSFSETYNVFQKFIKGNKLVNIKICIPRIVIEELITQYIEDYKSSKQRVQDSFDKLFIEASKIGWEANLVKNFDIKTRDYVEYIKKNCDKYLKNQDNIIIIDYPSKDTMFKIIERSVKKKKPFFKGKFNGKDFSDAGFKDVVFLESIIEYSENYKGEYCILTKDGFLHETDISEEISCICSIHPIDTGHDLINLFNKKYGVTDKSKYITFVESEYYKENIEQSLNCKILNNSFEININESCQNTIIENYCKINIEGQIIDVVVALSEENDFIEIKNIENGEVIYEWAV